MGYVLVVDDDPHIRELVRVILQKEGLIVQEAEDGAAALALMEASPADMVILDIMMPNMDGWELCRELRRSYDIPLLMLTAKGEMGDKVRGFNLGTDDYLVKPFDPAELTVRVRALMKRYRIAASRQVTAGELHLDRQTYEVKVRGEQQPLPPKEFELLFMLAGNIGRTLTRNQLIEAIWGYDFDGNERTLDVHVNRLRERFAAWDAAVRISTIRGLGYRLEAVK
ncbi:response regulator transcription factor [Paenibacillus arenilitoris]|uniref:Heme response regulator HssR n=1 Tax=Paenibacillus arenilitoris TaxID=2772299 RepID=A0A927CMF7_9BACL|nr:response regulator transcription factor [Paenibacillus arenilitoris]MBD2870249.1 response regulator transcription factor [Paenibacillus arenilitoris]